MKKFLNKKMRATKMQCFFWSFIFLINVPIYAQTDTSQYNGQIFTVVEEMPVFKGGEKELLDFISKNLQYPDIAKENGISGKVFLTFVIDTVGNVKSIKVLRGIGGGCDEAAKRVLMLTSGLWSPGKQRGIKTAVQFNIPINFKLTNTPATEKKPIEF